MMRDGATWTILLVAALVVALLGYRYYRASTELVELRQERARLQAEVEGVSAVQQLTESKAESEKARADRTIRNLRRERAKLRRQVSKLKNGLAEADRVAKDLDKRLALLKRESEAQVEKLKINITALEKDKVSLVSQLEDVQENLRRAAARRDELEERGAEQAKEIARLKQGLRAREAELAAMVQTRQVAEDQSLRWQDAARTLRMEVEQLKNTVAERERALKAVRAELDQQELRLAERAAEVHQFATSLSQKDQTISELRREIRSLQSRPPLPPTPLPPTPVPRGGVPAR
ncbi:MAG: hypothetical protein ACE5HK_01915 [Candidatus Methylomirabilales bacterium]